MQSMTMNDMQKHTKNSELTVNYALLHNKLFKKYRKKIFSTPQDDVSVDSNKQPEYFNEVHSNHSNEMMIIT